MKRISDPARDKEEIFYQYDCDRTVRVDCDAAELHFQGAEGAVPVVDGIAAIPNSLLRKAGEIRAWAWKNNRTLKTLNFAVIRRDPPPRRCSDGGRTADLERTASAHRRAGARRRRRGADRSCGRALPGGASYGKPW